MPAILLTRPTAAAARFAEMLRDRLGPVEIEISPLLRIDWTATLPEAEGIPIFTSRNGVEGFLRAGGHPAGPCWCVGDATAQVARAAGFTPRTASGDADALVAAILESGAPAPFLHFRGAATRGDVAMRLTKAGRPTADHIVYEQTLCDLTNRARNLLQRETPVILPLFSPRTAAQFTEVFRGRAPLFIAAMSAAVAAELEPLTPARVLLAESLEAGAMLDATERLFTAALRLEGGSGAK